jgi:predicted nucleic acid-binding protein
MSIVLDTNVISELARPRPDPRVIDWVGRLTAVVLSAVTVEEVFFGLAAKRNVRIERWFEDFLDGDCQIPRDHQADRKARRGLARSARSARASAIAGRYADRRHRRAARPHAGNAQ